MYRIVIFLTSLILFPFFKLSCQIVFKKNTTQINFPYRCFTTDSTYCIMHWGGSWNSGDCKIDEIDQNGFIINQYGYGDANEIMRQANFTSDSEILFVSESFNTNPNGGESHIIHVNHDFTVKKSIFFTPLSYNYFTPREITYFDNYYYVLGVGDDTANIVGDYYGIIKIDTDGHIIHEFSNFTAYCKGIDRGGYLHKSFDGKSLLFGASKIDSMNANNTQILYESYVLVELDTALQVLQLINPPVMDKDSFKANWIQHINIEDDSNYLLQGTHNLFRLNKNLQIIEDIQLANFQTKKTAGRGKRVYKNKHENSYMISGNYQLMKWANGVKIFEKDFLDDPLFVGIKDVIPTNDSGYFAIVKASPGIIYAKLDCMGNYINPVKCAPLQITDSKINKNDYFVYNNIDNWQINFKNIDNKKIEYKLYNLVGETIMYNHLEDRNQIIIEHSNYPAGIYLLQVKFGTQTLAIKLLK